MDLPKRLTIERAGAKVTESDIAAFESKWELSLPSDYRQFLSKFNGGLVTEADWDHQGVVYVTWLGHSRAKDKPKAVIAGYLYRLFGDETDFETVDYELRMHANNLPAGAVPIGRDPGSYLFLLMTEGASEGRIMLWDRTLIDGITPDDLGFVAHNLEEYFDRLEPEPEDWDAWEAAHANLTDPRQAPSAR